MKQLQKISLGVALFALSAFTPANKFESTPAKFATQKKSKIAPFKKGEQIKYLVHYGVVDAGEATLTVKRQDTTIDNKPVYHMVGEGKTLSVFEWFYKVRDVYQTYMDEDTYEPRKFVRRVNEGGYIINRDYHFVPEEKKVNTKQKGSLKTPKDVQDMLSSFYYLRTLDFSDAKKGQVYKINSFMDYKMYPFYVKYMGKETVKVKKGKYKCIKFVPVVQKGRVFKSEEDLEIWVSDDKNKVPILVKANLFVGSAKAELIEHKNLVEPLQNVQKKDDGFGWF